MNPQRLLQHFDAISEAPDAVAKLRRFILDLAVRGKLVEQDAGDEPASELLKRIAKEKVRLVEAGEIRKPKALAAIGEPPFLVPTSWCWVPIREVASERGQTIPDTLFTYIDVTAIDKESGSVSEPKILLADKAPSRARKITRKGDVIYSCVRPYLLNVAVIESDFDPTPIASTAFAVLNGHGLVLPRYLWIVLRSPFMVDCVAATMRGQAYPAINDADFAVLPFPLAPLAEQHRIVAKVDELMALCDQLQTARDAREQQRDRLVAASLHRFTANDDSDDTTDPAARRVEHARFHLQRLPRLTTNAEHIKEFRQAILNLAVCGRLVPQDSREEHAKVLFGRLKSAGGLRKKKVTRSQTRVAAGDATAQGNPRTPDGWLRCEVGEVCPLVTSGSRGWAEFYSDTGALFIRAQNIRFGELSLDSLAHVNPPKRTEGARTLVAKGDLLMVITGAGVTNAGLVVRDMDEAYVSQHVALIRPASPDISRWVLLCVMASHAARTELVNRAYGAGKPGLNLENIRSLKLPFPPLAEQHRIVAKVDELMALCDQLEASLVAAQSDRGRLLDALLHEALAEGMACRSTADRREHAAANQRGH